MANGAQADDSNDHPLADLGFMSINPQTGDVNTGATTTPSAGAPVSTFDTSPSGIKAAAEKSVANGQPAVHPLADLGFTPSQPDQPSAAGRFAGSFTEAQGLPADIRDWPAAMKAMINNKSLGKYDPAKYDPSGYLVNSLLNTIKGMVQAHGAASQSGLDEMVNKPGALDKVGGALKYVIGGTPIVGPNIVKSMNQFESGDYAGGVGTITGMLPQILLGDPQLRETTAAHLNAAGKYLFAKPRVQETILAGETKEMLENAEATARKRVISMAPDYSDISPVPGNVVSDVAQKALNDNIHGITPEPKPIADILKDNPGKFKLRGVEESASGELTQLYTRMSSDNPVSMADLHDMYTQLGKYGSKDLDGSVYKAVKQTRDSIGKIIDSQYESGGSSGVDRSGQWEDFKTAFSDMHKHWWDNDSPLYQSMHAKDPSAILSPFVGDSMERAKQYLSNYTQDGANPDAVKAINTLAKGMNQMQLRGLLQASGGLLASYLLRSEGAGIKLGTGAAAGLLTGRLLRGYLNTRPSFTNILNGIPTPFEPVTNVPPGAWGDFNKPNPLTLSPEDAVHVSSTLSPSDTMDIASLKDHPAVTEPNLKEDISAFNDHLDQLKNIGIMKLKGIMSIMQKKGVSYSEALKQYEASDKIGDINK